MWTQHWPHVTKISSPQNSFSFLFSPHEMNERGLSHSTPRGLLTDSHTLGSVRPSVTSSFLARTFFFVFVVAGFETAAGHRFSCCCCYSHTARSATVRTGLVATGRPADRPAMLPVGPRSLSLCPSLSTGDSRRERPFENKAKIESAFSEYGMRVYGKKKRWTQTHIVHGGP